MALLCIQNKQFCLHKRAVKKREKEGLGFIKGTMNADIGIK